MPATLESLQSMLDSAEEAYHRIMVGETVREIVDQNGERVTYNSATAPQLAAYIARLQMQIKTLKGEPTGPLYVRL